ncbi:MAG: DNA helicase UvrD [Deltaproteobacteria bacterium]|nr:DNA helicase UvrD [Deltaproteobacteria bacterium]
MKLIADLHIHTKYSRATSKSMVLTSIAEWARRKGIGVVGTGDFTYPAQIKSIETELEEAGGDLFTLKGNATDETEPRFMLTTEVSNIYKQGDKTRKIHSLIFAPSIKAVKKINKALDAIGNIKSDGRPILGITSQELIKIVMDSDPGCMLIPAHAWTPWFSIFGSKSGFNTIEECYGDYTKHIHAIETGLSSNPEMNSRLSMLDDITLISNSDAHSPSKLGREANIFDCIADYHEITDIIKTKDRKRFLSTVEFYPEEGKYHYDGHRDCGVLLSPEETHKAFGKCPVCARPVTVGVSNRVDELSDRPLGYKAKNMIPSQPMVPLQEIIAATMGRGVNTKGVTAKYMEVVEAGGSEFNVLLDMEVKEIEAIAGEKIAEAVRRVRSGEISIVPGFDGEFGKIKIFGTAESPVEKGPSQKGLF